MSCMAMLGRAAEVWMELDPLWTPGIPDVLLKPGWLLAVGPSPQGAQGHLAGPRKLKGLEAPSDNIYTSDTHMYIFK